MVERQLTKVGQQLKQLREELRVADEQLAHFAEIADDTRLRSLVSETPGADHDHRDAQRTADAFARHRADLAASITQLEATQDDLLDKMLAERG